MSRVQSHPRSITGGGVAHPCRTVGINRALMSARFLSFLDVGIGGSFNFGLPGLPPSSVPFDANKCRPRHNTRYKEMPRRH